MSFTKVTSAGIGSTELVTLDSLEVINNASIGGVLTYEDVTNVDSIGIITARAGVLVGSGITLSKDGDIFATGVTTTGSLVSSGAVSGTTGTFTGDVDIADKIVHTGDTDTAIRFSGADAISFETGGNQRALFGSDGKFIHSSTGAIAVEFTTSNGSGAYHKYELGSSGTVIGYTGSGGQLVTGSGADDFAIRSQANLVFSSGGATERLRIDSSGRLLLGTTTEGYASADDLTVATSGATGITIRSGTASGGTVAYSDGTSGDAEYRGYLQYDHNVDGLKIGTAGAEKLRITASGRLGVGIQAPTKLLDIATSASSDGIRIRSTGNTYNDLTFDANRTSANTHIGRIISNWNGTAVSYISMDAGSDTTNKDDGMIRFWTANGSGNYERLRINASGSLNIGNSSGYARLVDVSNSAVTDTEVQIRPNDGNAGEARLFLGGGGTNQNKCAIIFDPDGGYCRGNLHFCMESTGDTSDVDSSDKKMTILSAGYVTTPAQPYVMAAMNTQQTIAATTTTEVICDSESYDTTNNYDTSTGRYYAPVVGDYLCTFDCQYTGIVNLFHLGVGVNGTNPPGSSNFDIWNHTGTARGDNIARVIRITSAGQYISFFTYSSGGTLESNRTKITIRFLG